ncbi:MAG: ribonuclease H-like domain-containing protein [Deltaproteobacteria bacterium]|nr:ribonuclease H-like domain-containing protein [Deltaproteobacteria bacterium]
MLTHTFCHIHGIGLKIERSLWAGGISSWQSALCRVERLERGLLNGVLEAIDRLSAGDPDYFAASLPAGESWRLFSEFRGQTAYLDIETNGLAPPYGYITAISLYDGKTARAYVRGRNLDEFKSDIDRFKVIVTYNGRCFDVPFIRRSLGIRLPHAHIDLRFVLGSLGFKGGLKGCERRMGLDRGELSGADGYTAVLLWHDYERNGNHKALDTLLAYNALDAVNLESLMVEAYNLKLAATPFHALLPLAAHRVPPKPEFKPDVQTLERLVRRQLAPRRRAV